MKSLSIKALVLLISAGVALAGTPSMRELPRTDALRKIADAMEQRLADEVISTGTFDLAVVQVSGAAGDEGLAKLNVEVATKRARELTDKVPAGLAEATTVKAFTSSAVTAAGRRFAAVYAYAPESGEAEKKARTLWVLIAKAGIKAANGRVATTRVRYWDPMTGSKKYFTHTLFLNGETGRGVALSMVSGTM